MSISVQLQAVSGQSSYQTRARVYVPVNGIITVSPPSAEDLADLLNMGCVPVVSAAGFPTVVATVRQTGITASQTYVNLASAPTDDGLYVLDPYWIATTQDSSTNYDFTVTWTDQNGPQSQDVVSGPATYTSPLMLQGDGFVIPIHPAIGTAIEGVWTLTPTGILTVQPTSGNAGLLYAPGDTGNIAGGATPVATYEVLTVGAGGAVLTLAVTAKGAGYTVSTGNATVAVTGNGDGTLEVDITALAPTAAVFAYYATLTRLA